jgi:Family of unknown function (DUF5330)
MMFLIKTAFWLTILLLLVPTDGQQNNQIYGTAEAAVKDLAAFCDRNPETCVNGKNVFAMLIQKAEFGARTVMDFVEGRTETADALPSIPEAPGTMPLQPAIWDMGESQDTLSAEDRETAWGG